VNTIVDGMLHRKASYQANRLIETAVFRPDEREDVQQELILDYIHRLKKFDRHRGTLSGFAFGVMSHRSSVLAKRRAQRVRYEVLSGDLRDPAAGARQDSFEAFCAVDPTQSLLVALDVRRVVLRLPQHLQLLAELLPELAITEICQRMGKSRSRIYELIREIRRAFIRAGLGDPK